MHASKKSVIPSVIPKASWRNPLHLLATGLGAGASPVAPGTMGTLVAIPIYVWAASLSTEGYALFVLLLAVMGIGLCHKTAKDWGVHDHASIVWDEIVGYLITLFAMPIHWGWMLLGFGVFRFFDIVKPWPIRWVDRRVTGGFGIMLDDVLAGLASCLVLHGLASLIG